MSILQNDLNTKLSWDEQLSLNPDKTKHLTLDKCRYHLNGRNIDIIENCDIAIYIQSNVKVTTHCNQLVKKA